MSNRHRVVKAVVMSVLIVALVALSVFIVNDRTVSQREEVPDRDHQGASRQGELAPREQSEPSTLSNSPEKKPLSSGVETAVGEQEGHTVRKISEIISAIGPVENLREYDLSGILEAFGVTWKLSDKEASDLQAALESYKSQDEAVEEQRGRYVEEAIDARYEAKDYVDHEGYQRLVKTIQQDRIRLVTSRKINGENCTFVFTEDKYPELREYQILERELAQNTLESLRSIVSVYRLLDSWNGLRRQRTGHVG